MKKTYKTPYTILVKTKIECTILDGSIPNLETTRSASNQEDNQFPPAVGTNNGNENDPSYGNGQSGEGTPGNRAKMWDDAWDLPQWWNF